MSIFARSDWLQAKKIVVTSAVPGTDPEGAIAKFTGALEASVEAKRCVFFLP